MATKHFAKQAAAIGQLFGQTGLTGCLSWQQVMPSADADVLAMAVIGAFAEAATLPRTSPTIARIGSR